MFPISFCSCIYVSLGLPVNWKILYSQPGYNGSQYFVAFCLTITMYTVKKLDKSVVAVENLPIPEKEKIDLNVILYEMRNAEI